MLLCDVVTLGRYIGPHLSKYAQKNEKTIDVHTYPLGTTVVKAFTANDFVLYDAQKFIIEDLGTESIKSVTAVKIIWQIQKNRQNGQSITLTINNKFPTYVPSSALLEWSSMQGDYFSRMTCPWLCTRRGRVNAFISPEVK